ncbi:hypothetical protein PF004_g6679 [Phytophthora fragariae]|uniref:Uncharacterized protein n=1 Tax=Phytophthora fragariae TaxID=53985 RepID=A0A6G0PC41_9STRA|nr:hypothetical protein PF004_g6679 [Phytophthora fragariae]
MASTSSFFFSSASAAHMLFFLVSFISAGRGVLQPLQFSIPKRSKTDVACLRWLMKLYRSLRLRVISQPQIE